MNRITATLIKELQILLRDKTGMAILFVMPVMLVFIMTLLQHEAYRSLNETGVPVLLVNMDKDTLGIAIEEGFSDFPLCDIVIDHGESYASLEEIRQSVLGGTFVVAVYIPEGATRILREDVVRITEVLVDEKPLQEGDLKQVQIEILVDPIARKSFVMAISSGLREFVGAIKTQVLFQIMADEMQELIGSGSRVEFPKADFFTFREQYAVSREQEGIYKPNAIQHNVPAWAIFSIFFIVIPLAGSIIYERSEGMYTRLRTFPGSYLSLLSGKLFLYFLIAILQLVTIMVIGKYCLPLLGLPDLQMGSSWGAFGVLTCSVAMTAVGYGLLLGTLFDAAPQASIFWGD